MIITMIVEDKLMRFLCLIPLAALALNLSCTLSLPQLDPDYQAITTLLKQDTAERYAVMTNCTAHNPEELYKITLLKDSATARYVVKFDGADATIKSIKREAKLVKLGGNWVIAFNREL